MSILDLSNIRTKPELLDLLGVFFSLPDWWGRNWDAFNDCMGDDQLSSLPSHIEIIGIEDLRKNLSDDARILEEIFDDNNIEYKS